MFLCSNKNCKFMKNKELINTKSKEYKKNNNCNIKILKYQKFNNFLKNSNNYNKKDTLLIKNKSHLFPNIYNENIKKEKSHKRIINLKTKKNENPLNSLLYIKSKNFTRNHTFNLSEQISLDKGFKTVENFTNNKKIFNIKFKKYKIFLTQNNLY